MRARVFAFASLAVLAIFHSREAVFAGRAFYARDLHLQWFGQVESFVRTLHAGSLPLWNPWVSFGQPMLANANAQVLYPPTWLNLVMRPWTYYTLYFVAHLLLAGLGVRALARRLGASNGGALLSAALWICSGPFLSLGNLWNHLAGAAWIPWILDATLRALDAPSARRAIAWGACLAAPVFAGSPDFAVLGGLLSAAFVVTRPGATSWLARRRRLVTACAAVLIAFGLSAAQTLPSAELAWRSERMKLSLEERTYWSLHPAGLIETVVPVAWTELAALPSWSQALYEGREPYLFSIYLGVPALVLGCVAVERRRGRDTTVLGASGIVTAVFALGRHTPVYALLVALVPPLGLVRFPSKALVITAFALSLLAGFGYDGLTQETDGRPPRVARAVALLLALAALAGGVSMLRLAEHSLPGPIVLSLLSAAALGLASFLAVTIPHGVKAAAACLGLIAVLSPTWLHRSLNPTAPVALYTIRPEVLDALPPGSSQRLFVYDYMTTPGRSREHLGRDSPYLVVSGSPAARWLQALGERLYLLPPVGAGFGVLDSFGRDLLGIQPTPLAQLNAVTLLSDGKPAFSRLLRIGAVSQALALHDLGSELPLERSVRTAFVEDVKVFRIPDPVPRALVVSGARVSPEPLQVLLDPSFDPEREVLLPVGTSRAPRADFMGEARIVDERPDRVRLVASASSEAWLVLVDSYDPGWRARVDGQDATTLAANMAFRAVALPAGSHVVEMRYRPGAVVWGGALSLLSGVLAAGVLLRMA